MLLMIKSEPGQQISKPLHICPPNAIKLKLALTSSLPHLTLGAGICDDKASLPRKNGQVEVSELEAKHPVIDCHANRICQRQHQILNS